MRKSINIILKKNILIILLMISMCPVLGFSYARFVINTDNYRSNEMYMAELLYTVKIDDISTYTLTLEAGAYEEEHIIEITSLNAVSTNYKLIYQDNSNVKIEYASDYIDPAFGGILTKRTIMLRLTNNSEVNQTLSFSVVGGYSFNSLDEINIPSGYTEVNIEYWKYDYETVALYVNNVRVEELDKNKYYDLVSYTCVNGSVIRYDDDTREISINAGKPDKCSLYFNEIMEKRHTLLSKMLESDTPQSDASIDFTQISSDTNGKGLYFTSDISKTENSEVVYYYRGDVKNNYVVFAKQCFRIVRTNEDGSIKLVNRGSAIAIDANGAYGCPTNDNVTAPITSAFNTNPNDNAYVGYMYGTAGSSTSELTHANINDSTVKAVIDTWYENTFNEKERALIVDTIYCNDRSISSGNGYGKNNTTYAGRTRAENGTPQYKCPQVNDKFTVSTAIGNGALKYPVALLTADEAMYAGSKWDTEVQNYLYTIPYNWSMTASVSGSITNELDLSGVAGVYRSTVNDLIGAFPAVSLSSGTLVENGGDGTINNPYVIKVE